MDPVYYQWRMLEKALFLFTSQKSLSEGRSKIKGFTVSFFEELQQKMFRGHVLISDGHQATQNRQRMLNENPLH